MSDIDQAELEDIVDSKANSKDNSKATSKRPSRGTSSKKSPTDKQSAAKDDQAEDT